MNPEVKAKWLTALRSGVYRQSQGSLRNERNEYCCLGVLCELASQADVIPLPILISDRTHYAYNGSEAYLPDAVMGWAGLDKSPEVPAINSNNEPLELAYLNDSGYSFERIADLIEEHL